MSDALQLEAVKSHHQELKLIRENKIFKSQLCIVKKPMTPIQQWPLDFLHSSEKNYLTRTLHEKRYGSYWLGRYCAKQALCHYTKNENLLSFEIAQGVFDQPVVRYLDLDNIQISISHSGQKAVAIAFPETHPMAVDLEMIKSNLVNHIEETMNQSEIGLLRGLTEEYERLKVLTLFWTIKEALSKTLKTGLMADFEIYTVSDISQKSGWFISEFKYFNQYKAHSKLLGEYVLTLILPKRSQIILNDKELELFFL